MVAKNFLGAEAKDEFSQKVFRGGEMEIELGISQVDDYSKSYPVGHFLRNDSENSAKKRLKEKQRFEDLVKLAMDKKESVSGLKDQISACTEEHGPILSSLSAKDKYAELLKGPSFFLFPKYQKLLKSFNHADQVLCMMDKHSSGSGSFLSDLSLRVLRNFNISFTEK